MIWEEVRRSPNGVQQEGANLTMIALLKAKKKTGGIPSQPPQGEVHHHTRHPRTLHLPGPWVRFAAWEDRSARKTCIPENVQSKLGSPVRRAPPRGKTEWT